MHIVALIANILGLSIAIVWAAKTNAYDAYLAVVALTGSLPLSLRNAVNRFVDEAIRQYESPSDFVLLGSYATGKTVYLATAINLLMHQSKGPITFLPGSQASIERVMTWCDTLHKGQWLPRTSSSEEGRIAGTLIRYRRFRGRIESQTTFIDLPGESFHDMEATTSESELWIHESTAFKSALRARYILFFVDPSRGSIFNYVAALQVLARTLPLSKAGKISKAVCIIFSKCDLYDSQEEKQKVIQYAEPLLTACERLSTSHKYFFVSSTGSLIGENPGTPPIPENVLEPIAWCLNQTSV